MRDDGARLQRNPSQLQNSRNRASRVNGGQMLQRNTDKRPVQECRRNWEAPLPFKTDNVLLPDNKGHFLRRLLSLKRLLNDKGLKDDYLTFMKKILDNGHANQVPVDQLQTTKGKGHLLQGPHQLNSLIGVLTRF